MFHDPAAAGGVRPDSCRVVDEVGQMFGVVEMEQDMDG